MVFQTVIGGYSSIELVTWSSGSYEQIAAMLNAHYRGKINIANFWNVGDYRTVTLGAITGTSNIAEGADAQEVQLVLLNAGGKTLVQSQFGTSECAFVVGVKNVLNGTGEINSNNISGWSASGIRTHLNNNVYAAFPDDLKALMKDFINKTQYFTSSGSSTGVIQTSEDRLALAGANEVFGNVSGEDSQFAYYTTQANRIKRKSNGNADYWWTRTASSWYQSYYVDTSGSRQSYVSNQYRGIAPIFVI